MSDVLLHSLRAMVAHKVRLLLTIASVAVGVAFVSGTLVLNDTTARSFDELYGGLTQGVDVAVRAEATTDGSSQRPSLPQSVIDTVAAVPGVENAAGSVTGFAMVLDKAGRAIQPGGAPTLGASLHHDPGLAAGFTVREGQRPGARDEVALDARTATEAGFEVGDPVRVMFEDHTKQFRLVGILGFGGSDTVAGATMAAFDLRTAQQVLGKDGVVDQVDVAAVAGTDAEQLRRAVAAALPAGAQADTGEQLAAEGSEQVREGLGVFTSILMAFAVVALVVGSVVIWNTFSVVMAQRRRDVGLLRSLGATRRQVLNGSLIEAVVIGAIGSSAGLLLGFGLASGIRALLAAADVEIPSTTPVLGARTVAVAFAVGMVVTTLAALAPAVGATRVQPMEALRASGPGDRRASRLRSALGASVLLASVLGLVAASTSDDLGLVAGLSALGAVAGLALAGPLLASLLARAVPGRAGTTWTLAAQTIHRAPRRSAATALALAIGMGIVSAVSVTAASTKASVAELVAAGNSSDVLLKASATGGQISAGAVQVAAGLGSTDAVVELRTGRAMVDGADDTVAGISTVGVEKVLDLGTRSGASPDELQSGQVLVAADAAEELGLAIGDDVELGFAKTGARQAVVAGTFERTGLVGARFVLPLPDYAQAVPSQMATAVYVAVEAGVDPVDYEGRITAALRDYPNVEVLDSDELVADAQKSIDQGLGIVTALLLLSVVVAMLGIANTLALSVVERIREIGLLRAVGATRRQVRSIIRREAVLMAFLGATTGLTIGALGGTAMSNALAENGISTVQVPTAQLLLYGVIAMGVAVIAAIGPAHRASRVDVLRAVTTD